MVGARASSDSEKKPAVAIVGIGNCGSTLAWALHATGFPIVEMIAHRAPTSEQKSLAKDTGAELIRWKDWQSSAAEVVWICVRDDEIAKIAREMAKRFDSRSVPKVFIHTSAPRSFHELDPLKKIGAAIGSAHPARSFPAPQRVPLTGTYFAIEGDAAARKAATAMAASMNALPFTLRAKDKALYHAFCVLSSPLLIAHLAAAETLGVAAGVPKAIAPRLLEKLGGGTFANWQRKGAAKSFSGPISRGDIETLRLHLASLSQMPEMNDIYRALSEFAVRHFPTRRRTQIAKLFSAPKGKR